MKGSWSSMSIIPITLCTLFLFIYYFEEVFAAPTRHLCRPDQRDALLKFKDEFEIGKSSHDDCVLQEGSVIFPHPKTESWENSSDCCSWEGIKCNAKSGKVIKIDLNCSCLYGRFQSNSSLQNLRFLTAIDLSYNDFSGQIPSWIGKLSHLTSLKLSDNHFSDSSFYWKPYSTHNAFTGTLPSLFTIPSLERVDLSNNQLNGTLEFVNISSPSKLEELSIGRNNFTGPIPSSISKLTNLWMLDLSHFNTQGPVDFSTFSHLKSLGHLYLSNLNTITTMDLSDILENCKSLATLNLSGNHVSSTNKSPVSDPSSQSLVYYLHLSGCGITKFPELLRSYQELIFLDISNNKIKGQVPGWLWTRLDYVILSNNNFNGFENPTRPALSTVPKSSMQYLIGSNNNFTGKIPSFICTWHSLEILDLSNNNFNGSIPRCMGNIHSNLSLVNLRSLDVGHNQLVGQLPRSLINFSNLEVLNVESNRINDKFPFWLSYLPELKVLVLRSNAFHGPILQASFTKLQIIDISHNQFSGTLPSD